MQIILRGGCHRKWEAGGWPKSHWEVGGSRILDQDVGGLDFASQLRDVGGFVFKRFSPKQRHQIDTNQAIPSASNARSD